MSEAEARAIVLQLQDEDYLHPNLTERALDAVVAIIAAALQAQAARIAKLEKQYENSQRTVDELTKSFEDEEETTTDLRAQMVWERQRADALAERLRRVEGALVTAAVPLEVLALDLNDTCFLAPDVTEAISKAVAVIRATLAAAPQEGSDG